MMTAINAKQMPDIDALGLSVPLMSQMNNPKTIAKNNTKSIIPCLFININNNTFTNILLLWFGFSKVLVFVLLVFFLLFLTAWLGLGLAWLLLSWVCRLCCCWLCWASSCFPAGVGPWFCSGLNRILDSHLKNLSARPLL